MDYVSYCNDLVYRLEQLIWHELGGRGMDFVGIDFLKSRNIKGDTVEEVIDSCVKEIKDNGIVKDMAYSIHASGMLLKMTTRGCLHLPKEAKLNKDGIKPCLCIICNMIIDQIIEKLNYENVIIADRSIDEEKGECLVKIAMFETADKVGQVSDWTGF